MKVIGKVRCLSGPVWSDAVVCTGNGHEHEGKGCGAVMVIDGNDLFSTCREDAYGIKYSMTVCCCECGALTNVNLYRGPFTLAKQLPSSDKWFSNRIREEKRGKEKKQ